MCQLILQIRIHHMGARLSSNSSRALVLCRGLQLFQTRQLPQVTDGRASAGPVDVAAFLAQPGVQEQACTCFQPTTVLSTTQLHDPLVWQVVLLHLCCAGRHLEAAFVHCTQVQQALHRRAVRLKKAGHRVARKQQELMHIVHISTDQRKVIC